MAKVAIIDQNSGKKYHVQVPTNIKTAQVLPALIKTLKLPIEGAGGEPLQYDLTLETTDGKVRLTEDDVLAEAGVVDGVTIRITPQMKAGVQDNPLSPAISPETEIIKPARHFKLVMTKPDGGSLFETDFLAEHFEPLIRQLAVLLVQKKFFDPNEPYHVRVIPRTDDQPKFNKPEIIHGQVRKEDGEGLLDLAFETASPPVENIAYLTIQIRSVDTRDAYRFDWKLDEMIGGLITESAQYLLDSNKIKSGDHFHCSLSAHEISLPNIHAVARPKKLYKSAKPVKAKTPGDDVPISADQIIVDQVETLPPVQDDFEIVVERVEELIKPEPRSLKDYPNAELIGKKADGQIPIFARRGAMVRALESAKRSAGAEEEVGGFLVGSVHCDPETNEMYVDVAEVVEADKARGTYLSVDFDYESWRQVLDRIDRDFPGKFLVGWYHTHLVSRAVVLPVEQPNSPREYEAVYAPFFSHMDVFIQRHFFPDAWHVALLLDLRCGTELFYAWQNGQILPTYGYYLYGE